MKECFVVLLILISLVSRGQLAQAPLNDEGEGKFYFGVYFSPEMADVALKNNDGSQTSEDLIEFRNGIETFKFGYTTGATLGYKLTESISLESGLTYCNRGYRTKKQELSFGDQTDPRQGFIFSSDPAQRPTHAFFKYSNQYIGVPIALQYARGRGKWGFSSRVGLTAEYLLRTNTTAVLSFEEGRPDRRSGASDQEFNKFSIATHVGVGVDYRINPHMKLSAMPIARLGILAINSSPITRFLYNSGIQFGWYVTL